MLAVYGAAPQSTDAADAFYDRPEYYVVKKGDTLKQIAARFELDYRDLAAWNKIPENKRVAAGERLRLYPPGRAPSHSNAAANSAPPLAAAPAPAGDVTEPSATTPEPVPKKKPAPKPAKKPAPKAGAAAAAASSSKEKEELEHLRNTTLNLIKLLVAEGVLSQQKAEAIVREAERGAITPTEVKPAAGKAAVAAEPAAQPQPPAASATEPKPATDSKVVRVPYVPEVVKNEIRDQVKEDVIAQAKAERWAEPNAVPEWVQRITFEGDIRLRYQDNFYQSSNTPAATYQSITGNTNVTNTTNDETWLRIRARLGLRAQLTDTLDAKVSIATGNAQNPVSLNQDLANYFSGYSVQLDNAYVRYRPRNWIDVTAGRFPKPFFSSELLWWEDLNMDGIAATVSPKLTRDVTGFVTAGAFAIQDTQSSPSTPNPKWKYLLGLQGGLDWKLGADTRFKIGLAYYDFQNIEGEPNTVAAPNANDWTVPKFTQKGNSLFDINFGTGNPAKYALASQFRVADLTAMLTLAQFDPYVVRVSGDVAKNLAFNRTEVAQRTGLQITDERDLGWQAQVLFGAPELRAFNDWQAFVMYRYLQGDAVVDAFNDPDFHLGGTNAKGYTLGLRYGLGSNAWLRLRWMSADQIDGPPLSIDVLQLDFNARF